MSGLSPMVGVGYSPGASPGKGLPCVRGVDGRDQGPPNEPGEGSALGCGAVAGGRAQASVPVCGGAV